jgi:hypothetical protein
VSSFETDCAILKKGISSFDLLCATEEEYPRPTLEKFSTQRPIDFGVAPLMGQIHFAQSRVSLPRSLLNRVANS